MVAGWFTRLVRACSATIQARVEFCRPLLQLLRPLPVLLGVRDSLPRVALGLGHPLVCFGALATCGGRFLGCLSSFALGRSSVFLRFQQVIVGLSLLALGLGVPALSGALAQFRNE